MDAVLLPAVGALLVEELRMAWMFHNCGAKVFV
jgi:hypothetical protein